MEEVRASWTYYCVCRPFARISSPQRIPRFHMVWCADRRMSFQKVWETQHEKRRRLTIVPDEEERAGARMAPCQVPLA
jgi:hypothetical protein